MNNFMRFDVFRKMPKDLTEPTFFGAIGKKREYLKIYSVNPVYGNIRDTGNE